MIKNININGFKCFDDETIELRNLTILTGINSSGKSSLIQAILISAMGEKNQKIIENLGDFSDIKNKYTNPDTIKITIDENRKVTIKKNKNVEYNGFNNHRVIYLSANRVGISSLNDFQTYETALQFNINGAYTVGFFEKNKSTLLNEKLQNQKANSLTLDGQLNYWLKYITDSNLIFDTEEVGNKVKAFYKIDKIKDNIKPENIGTGISYLVSILTTCLLAKEQEIVIIENPEIHLYPLAQARLGEFFSFVVNAGVQVIIETHNDHIINSICYQQYKNKLKEKQVIIQYKNSSTKPFEKIEIKNGQFINPQGENRFPQGFFDATLQELFEING
jgi:predicted ATPase